jgi:hypothetical protein
VFDLLQQWLLAILTIPALPALPPQFLHFPGFPKDLVFQLGVKINRTWNQQANFKAFLQTMLGIPCDLAVAFGFRNIVYVFDHLDICDLILQPLPRFDPPDTPIGLPDLLTEILSRSLYFIATKDDSLFFELFHSTEGRHLGTERLISKESPKQIIVADPQVTISFEMCHGCPGYCALFDRVFAAVEKTQGKKENKAEYTKFKPVVESARKAATRQEVIRLCSLLALTDTEGVFEARLLNTLEERKEIIARAK